MIGSRGREASWRGRDEGRVEEGKERGTGGARARDLGVI